MKEKRFTHGITFFVTEKMYSELKEFTSKEKMAVSELIREAIEARLLHESFNDAMSNVL